MKILSSETETMKNGKKNLHVDNHKSMIKRTLNAR